MFDSLPEKCGTGDWSDLLASTRDALAGLRADELEQLARRAECAGEASAAQALSAEYNDPFAWQSSDVVREHRLLFDLLRATNDNLLVLKRLQDQAATQEVNARWVR
jgi:hypothetical protein